MPSPRRSFFMIPITLVEIVEDIRKKCAVKTRMRNKKNYSDGHLYHCLDARVAAEEDVAGFGFSTRRYYLTGSRPRGRPRGGAACRSTIAGPLLCLLCPRSALRCSFPGRSVTYQDTVLGHVGNVYFGPYSGLH